MTEQQFNIVLFHMRAMLGLVCLQAGIMLGFAWKYLYDSDGSAIEGPVALCMTIAGLWDGWTDRATGENLKSCAMAGQIFPDSPPRH
jgi:hypothetical protein